jgi:elongator complex protein 1
MLISSNATSFVTSGSFLIYVSSNHESVYIPFSDVASVIASSTNADDITKLDYSEQITALSSKWEKRRVERGSRIVAAIPSAMNVVLQMPRGNLETITPRPLALEVIRSNIARYKSSISQRIT